MARRARSVAGGEVYHVINRGNCRMKIFRKTEDCMAFMRLMEQVNEPIEKQELNRLRVHVQRGRP